MKIIWLEFVISTLLCVIPANPFYARIRDPCYSYQYTPTDSMDKCIDYILKNRNSTFNHTHDIVQIILRVAQIMTIDELPDATAEGIVLSAYANPFHFPNAYGDSVPCDDSFCEQQYNALKEVNTTDIFKLCLYFCSRPSDTRTPSSSYNPLMETSSTIISARSSSNPAINTISINTPDNSVGLKSRTPSLVTPTEFGDTTSKPIPYHAKLSTIIQEKLSYWILALIALLLLLIIIFFAGVFLAPSFRSCLKKKLKGIKFTSNSHLVSTRTLTY